MNDCLFCSIVSGATQDYVIWEDEDHIAFLSIYPNTEGVTVVIPKKHYASYAFDLEDDVLCELMKAVKQVAKLLDRAFEDVSRTAMVFEGFGIDHVHAKLYPMHGTNFDEWRPVESNIDQYFDKYHGYISSHDAKRAKDADLKALAERLRGKN